MDDGLEATAGLASLPSSGAAPARKGKPRAPRKTATLPKKKKEELTPEERVMESAKRKGRRHAQDARDETTATAAIAAAAQQEDTNARMKAAMREALLYLGVNPSQHELVNAAVAAAAANTVSLAYPQMMPPESPRASSTQSIPGFHVYPQRSRFSGNARRR
ncbi:putative serine/threonine-protein kinase [Hordeum vulgare]|nr:putative serine/threonine-protein kinase [Hordeum vulgare]